jgi:hypothetical protein
MVQPNSGLVQPKMLCLVLRAFTPLNRMTALMVLAEDNL